jgi:hypothetical protein
MIVIMLPTLVKTEELSPEKVNKNNRIFHNSFTKQYWRSAYKRIILGVMWMMLTACLDGNC